MFETVIPPVALMPFFNPMPARSCAPVELHRMKQLRLRII
jgi:hypothetical protein